VSVAQQPDHAEHTHRKWGVLRHMHFRHVIAAGFVSNVGTWTEFFAIQMFVAQATGRLDDQGKLGLYQQAPIFLLGLLGGLAADRFNRRTLLVVTQLLAGLVAVGVAIVTMIKFDNPRSAVHWLFFLGALNGCVMAFNFPAWQVLTPRLVPKDELGKAITLNGIQFNLARVIGPAIAGFVLASFGWTPLLWFNAFTFLLMSVVIMTTPPSPAPEPTGESVWPRIREALAFLFLNRGPRSILLAQFLLSLLAAPLVRLLSNFIIDVYNLTGDKAERVGGTLLAIQGVGAVLGGLSLRFIPTWYPKHHFIPMAVTGLGLSISLFAITTAPISGYLAMFVCGWFWIWSFNQSWAAMQVITPDHLRGRALSLVTVAAFGATAIGVFTAGELGEYVKSAGLLRPHLATQGAILMLSVPLLVAGIVMMSFRVPEVDGLPRIKRGEPGASGKSRSLIEAVTASEHRPL
jgi:MFS family permease